MRRKSHLSKPAKRRRHKAGSNGLSSIYENSQDSSVSRDSGQEQDEDDYYEPRTRRRPAPCVRSRASSFDSFSHDSFSDQPLRREASADSFAYNLDDSLPLTDQLKRAIRPGTFDLFENMHWQPTEVYNYIGIHPECCVEEEDFTLIKKELNMDHIGKSSTWNEDRSYSWYPNTTMKERISPLNHSFGDELYPQPDTFSSDGTLHGVQVLPTGEVVTSVDAAHDYFNEPPYLRDHVYGKPRKSIPRQTESYKNFLEKQAKKSESMKEGNENKSNSQAKNSMSGHECEKCGTFLKTTIKMKDHLERHKQLESLKRHAGQLPSREQLVKEVPVLVNRALKGIMDDKTLTFLERKVEAYAKRLYYNSFPLWKEISRELVHEVWQYVTLTDLSILPAVDWDFFLWSRNRWLTSGGRKETFILNLIFLYPDDSEVVEVFFYKFFVKLNDAVYKFAMRCLGSPDIVSDSFCVEPDIRSDTGSEELHTLCSLVLRTYVKRASQNKSVEGWSAIYKCMKRNFVEIAETGEPPKSSEMQEWALGQSNQLITTKQAFKFFALVEAVIENIKKVNPQCDGPVAQHRMVLRAVYLRQEIIRAWDKLVAKSHFDEMDSLYVLEMLVKSFAFFSGCASARKQKKDTD